MTEDTLHFAPPGTRRLCVMREGRAVVREWKIPKPVVLVDTREQHPYSFVQHHPNAVCGTYAAIEAKFGIPIIYTSRSRTLATERAASWLSKHFTYWWLEQNGHDRVLIDSDGL